MNRHEQQEPSLRIRGKWMRFEQFDMWLDEINTPGISPPCWTRPTPGCRGNVREQQTKRLRAMLRLTNEELQILGLWRYADEETKNAFGHWPHEIFHV